MKYKKHQTKKGEKQERGEEGEWKAEGEQKEESSSLGNYVMTLGVLCE